MNWYVKVMKQYSDFKGRARRKEYWMFTLFYLIFAIVVMALEFAMGMGGEMGVGMLYLIFMLGHLVPSLAVSVRRLHDVGKSGWMILIALIPVIGWIWLLVLALTDSKPGDNEYGARPK